MHDPKRQKKSTVFLGCWHKILEKLQKNMKLTRQKNRQPTRQATVIPITKKAPTKELP
jgi:hypothetical protein